MVPRTRYIWQFAEYLVTYLWDDGGHKLRTKVQNPSAFTLLCDWFRGKKKRFPYKKERSKFRNGRKPMLLLITIWLVARELACSGQLVKCGVKSQTGEKNKGGGEGDRDPVLSLLTPPPSLFFLLASFCAIPVIWTLGTGHKRACVRKTVECWVICLLIRIAHKKISSQNNQGLSYCVGWWSPLGVATPRLVSF